MATVTQNFEPPSATQVLVSHAVRGGTARAIALAMTWLNGHGQHLLPANRVAGKVFSGGSTLTFRAKLGSRVQATRRLWVFTLGVASGGATVTFTDPSGGTTTWGPIVRMTRVGHVETVAAPADGPVAVSYSLAIAGGSSPVLFYAASCLELQRRSLALDATDDGVDADSIVTAGGGVPAPIFDDGNFVSLGALSRTMSEVRKRDNRTLFEFSTPSNDGISTSSGTPVDLFEEGPVLLASKLFSGSVTGEAEVHIFYRTSASTAGQLDMSMTSGDSGSISLPAATGGAWVSKSLLVDCEDPSADDGRRSSRDDVCKLQLLRTSGAGSVSIEVISIIEVRT